MPLRPGGKLDVDGVTYGTRDKNIRNSFVCFQDPCSQGHPSQLRAGQITQLFLQRRASAGGDPLVEAFVVLEEFAPLSEAHAAQDPYRRFPLLNTSLKYNRFHASHVVIRPVDISSHFAALVYVPEGIGESCIVVCSLDRVSLGYLFDCALMLTSSQS